MKKNKTKQTKNCIAAVSNCDRICLVPFLYVLSYLPNLYYFNVYQNFYAELNYKANTQIARNITRTLEFASPNITF